MPFNDAGLTQEQSVAALCFDAPLAMIAGAGSGKTKVLVERYLALVRRGVQPERILTVTFTNEAADELRARILNGLVDGDSPREVIDAVENSPWIGTIHSFCYRLLETYGSLLNKPRLQTIADDFESISLFSKHYDAWFSALPDSTFDGLLKYFSAAELSEIAEALFLNPIHFQQAVSLIKDREDLGNRMLVRLNELLLPVVNAMREELHQKGAYTFNDLETSAYELIQVPLVTRQLQGQFEALLIDEFQDTSRLQWSILRSLLDDNWAKLFIVGDPKQSIYGFRHADIKLFREVNDQICQRAGILQTLSINFRTRATLLQDINKKSKELFELSTVPFEQMTAGRTEEGNRMSVVPYSLREGGSRNDWQTLERETLITQVREKAKAGISLNSLALLFRNSDRIKEYADALEAEGLTTYTETTSGLFESYDILDIVHYLEATAFPSNDFSVSAFLISPYIGLSIEELHTLLIKRQKEEKTLPEVMMRSPDKRYDWFIRGLSEESPSLVTALERLFSETRMFPHFSEGLLTLLEPLLKTSCFAEAVQALRLWERKGVFIQRTLGSRDHGIRLMTVHGAKGLEFPHVFLADCLRQSPRRQPPLLVFPGLAAALKFRTEDGFGSSENYENLWNRLRAQEDEEAKRILYVAMTRARDSLTICLPKALKTIPKGSWASFLCEGSEWPPLDKSSDAPFRVIM